MVRGEALKPRPGVLAIDPYVPCKSAAPGVSRVFKLSSIETPVGPSPNAILPRRRQIGALQVAVGKVLNFVPRITDCLGYPGITTGALRSRALAGRSAGSSHCSGPTGPP